MNFFVVLRILRITLNTIRKIEIENIDYNMNLQFGGVSIEFF